MPDFLHFFLNEGSASEGSAPQPSKETRDDDIAFALLMAPWSSAAGCRTPPPGPVPSHPLGPRTWGAQEELRSRPQPPAPPQRWHELADVLCATGKPEHVLVLGGCEPPVRAPPSPG